MNKPQASYAKAFTIVELLIVIVVIAILAAISIVAYNGIRDSADASAVQSDLRNFGQKAHEFYVLHERYPANDADLASLNIRVTSNSYQLNSSGNFLYCTITTGTEARFVLAARTRANKAYTYSSQGGLREYTGTWSGAHATDCPHHGIPNGAANRYANQAYQPPDWGSPGWAAWTGGIPAR